ncbi:hypothetical protein FKM82_026471 [Ascaphus truei]
MSAEIFADLLNGVILYKPEVTPNITSYHTGPHVKQATGTTSPPRRGTRAEEMLFLWKLIISIHANLRKQIPSISWLISVYLFVGNMVNLW